MVVGKEAVELWDKLNKSCIRNAHRGWEFLCIGVYHTRLEFIESYWCTGLICTWKSFGLRAGCVDLHFHVRHLKSKGTVMPLMDILGMTRSLSFRVHEGRQQESCRWWGCVAWSRASHWPKTNSSHACSAQPFVSPVVSSWVTRTETTSIRTLRNAEAGICSCRIRGMGRPSVQGGEYHCCCWQCELCAATPRKKGIGKMANTATFMTPPCCLPCATSNLTSSRSLVSSSTSSSRLPLLAFSSKFVV